MSEIPRIFSPFSHYPSATPPNADPQEKPTHDTPDASSPQTDVEKNVSIGTLQPLSYAQGNRPIMKDNK